MLISNFNSNERLVYGLRLLVTHLSEYITTSKFIQSDNIVLMTCIKLTSPDPSLPFQTIKKFPIDEAFAVTINESQIQMIERTGSYLFTCTLG